MKTRKSYTEEKLKIHEIIEGLKIHSEPFLMNFYEQLLNLKRYQPTELEKYKDPDLIEEITLYLKKDDPKIRRLGIGILEILGASEAIPALIKCLKDKNNWVRERSAEALGNLGCLEAKESLIETLKDYDSGVRNAAMQALFKLGITNFINYYIKFLKQNTRAVRIVAIKELGNLSNSQALESLFASLKDKDNFIRYCVVEALGKFNDTSVISPLILCLNDKSLSVREKSIEILKKFGKSAIGPLITNLKKLRGKIKLQIMNFLSLQRDLISKEHLPPLRAALINCLNSKNAEIRLKALILLRQLNPPQIVNHLLKFTEDPSLNVRRLVFILLSELGQLDPIEKDFPQFLQLLQEFSELEHYLAPYWEIVDLMDTEIEEKQDKIFQIVDEIGKKADILKAEFQTIDLLTPRNTERSYLFTFILTYFKDNSFLQDISEFQNIERKIDHNALVAECIAQMKSFKDPIALAEGIDFISKHLEYRTDPNFFRQFRLDLAEMAARLDQFETMSRLFYYAFNRYRDYDALTEYVTTIQIFFDETRLAKYHHAIHQTGFDHNPIVYFLEDYPYLKAFYKKDPLRFFYRWKNKDKLQPLLDTIHQISYPFNDHDKQLFENFRQLVIPICKACLTLDGLYKYFHFAEAFIKHGEEQIGFTIYQLTCQHLETLLIKYSHAAYRQHKEESFNWYKYGNIHLELDKKVSELFARFPFIYGSALLTDLFKILLNISHPYNTVDLEGTIMLYTSIIKNQPELAKYFLSLFKKLDPDLDSVKSQFLLATPSNILLEELVPLLEAIKVSKFECQEVFYETFIDIIKKLGDDGLIILADCLKSTAPIREMAIIALDEFSGSIWRINNNQ
ncbi:MAG: HEAT repeat domain-containing protein [Candidatus Helarchaeota archaeon]